MKKKKRRLDKNGEPVKIVDNKTEYPPCSCGGDVKAFSDRGVRCVICDKLYGIWYERKYWRQTKRHLQRQIADNKIDSNVPNEILNTLEDDEPEF